MPILTRSVRWSLVCGTLSLSACGGSSVESVPPAMASPPPAPPQTTLSISASALALAAANAAAQPVPIPGRSRVLTVTNTGTAPAVGVVVDPSAILPVGTSITSHCAGALAPLASCTFTITPGTVATAAPVTLNIQGSNTHTVSSTVELLKYGSVYQGGYVFAIDDTTPDTGSVGGKVAAMADEPSMVWSPTKDLIPGIDELSTVPCAGALDGACNTAAIVAYYNALNVDANTYAAGRCSVSTAGGYTGWYLPAICEAGFNGIGLPTGCGTRIAPTLQNMHSNLYEIGFGALALGGGGNQYWTSTSSSHAPQNNAWAQGYNTQYNSPQVGPDKVVMPVPVRVRCVRAITY